MSLKNCLPCTPQVPYADVARLNALDQRRDRGRLRCATVQGGQVAEGAAIELLRVDGEGALRTFFVELTGSTREAVAGSRISVYVDGEQTPSVTGTIADFYLSGREAHLFNGDYAGKTLERDDGRTAAFYRYLFVPYRRSCVVTLQARDGELRRVLSQLYHSSEAGAADADYGRWNRAFSTEKRGQCGIHGQSVEVVHLRGRGVFHSLQISLENPDSRGQYMEGNIEIYLDGEDFPSYQSSGTEEFFMGGVYFASLHESSYSGCTRTFNDGSENPRNLVSAHRLFIEDPMTFDRELRVVWHNGEHGQGPPEYRGVTDYTFHGIYYLDTAAVESARAIPAGRLSVADFAGRIRALDRDADSGAFASANLECQVEPGKLTTLGSVSGRGTVGAVFLEGVPDSGPGELVLEVDGEAAVAVELPLFFFNAPAGADPRSTKTSARRRYVGAQGGSPAEGTYFRYLDVPFTERFSVAVRSSVQARITGRIEYREGPCGQGAWESSSRRQTVGYDREAAVDFQGEGLLQEVVLFAGGSVIDGEVHVQVDGEPGSIVFSPTAESFFLAGRDPGSAAGGPRTVGAGPCQGIVENEAGRFLAFRLFRRDPIPFSRSLRLVYFHRHHEPVNVTIYAAVRRPRPAVAQPADASQPDLVALQARLNQLDGASHLRFTKCYSSMESRRGSLEPGQTSVLWEDFGPGAIRLIRLGTPPCGPALLAARLQFFVDGASRPAIDTTVGRFFSARMDDPIYWYNSRWLSRPSKIYREQRSGHVSCFRYLLLPYRRGVRVTLTAPDTGGIWGFNQLYYQGGTSTQVDFGTQEYWEDLAFTGTVPPHSRVLLAEVNGRGRVASWQLVVENAESEACLQGRVEILVGEKPRPVVDSALAAFFMSCARMSSHQAYLSGYTDFWQDKHREEQGHFASALVGWPRRGTRAPYASTLYRLFGADDPLPFDGTLRVYWTNAADSPTEVRSDLLVSTAEPSTGQSSMAL